MRSFVIHTVGCKVNQYESQAVAGLLGRRGLCPAGDAADADLIVVNTCCVTSRAAAKCRQALRRAVRRQPGADVLILGCYATQHGQALRRAARQAGGTGRIHVAGHHRDVAACVEVCAASPGEADSARARPAADTSSRKHASGAVVKPSRGDGRRVIKAPSPAGRVRNDVWMRAGPSALPAGGDPSAARISTHISTNSQARVKRNMGTSGLEPIARFAGRQRAFVKVQDGCDAFCSYCVVPHLRSNLWWRPPEQILREVRALVAAGHREVVLCGIFLGAYGRDTAVRRNWTRPAALPGLLRRVAEVEGLWRVRLSSLHVGDVTDELLDVCADCPAVAPHLHLPLQSGSTPILRRMNRQYTAEQFLAAAARVKQALPEPAITTDVLVGFPGEAEDDFAATLHVARQVGFSKVHAFGFSPRPGTAAWTWRRQAPPAHVVRLRRARLAELERRTAHAYRARFLGRTVDVLVEQPNKRTPPACAHGLTDRYLDVTFPADDPAALVGRVLPIRITARSDTGLAGTRPTG